MPATTSSSRRPVRQASTRKPSPKVLVEEASSSSASDSEEQGDGPTEVAKLRRARSAYYAKSPQERMKEARPMAQEVRQKSRKKRTVRKASASTASVHLVSSKSQVSHRRRRRKKKAEEGEDDDGGGVYVYKQVQMNGSRASMAEGSRRRRSTATLSEKKPSAEPKWASALDRLGLANSQRHASTRSIKPTKTGGDTLQRRHSYHGEPRRRESIRKEAGEDDADDAERSRLRRSTSVRDVSSKSASSPAISRSNTTKTRRTRQSTPVLPVVPEEPKLPTIPRPRTTSVFGSLFSPAKVTAPETQVTCLTCMSDDVLISRSAKLGCGHRMCYTCLKRIFTLSVTDPAHMPPKCCTSECIPLKHVDKLFDTKFKVKWNRKFQEYTTKNRIYCPSRGCGAWIPPKDIRSDPHHSGRKYGKCTRCKTRICATCNNKWHLSRECPNDDATRHFVEMAKEKGWQRCHNCKATVELKEGCNHMTCRCTAEFCMICGAKWKTCDCPWFNYAAVENDRLQHMNIAQIRRVALDPGGAEALNAPRAYHEELERRRAQEQRDEELARRMQGLDLDLMERGSPRRRGGLHNDDPAAGGGNVFAFGNAAPHFLNDNFVQRAQNILTAPYNNEQREAADRLVAEIRGQQRTDDIDVGLPQRRATLAGRRGAQATAAPIVGVVPGRGREAEVLVPRRVPGNYEAQAARVRPRGSVRRPTARATAETGSASPAEQATPTDGTTEVPSPTPSGGSARLAGLTRRSTQGRVDAWRRHVEVEAEG